MYLRWFSKLIGDRETILRMSRGFLVIRKTVAELTCKHLVKSWIFFGRTPHGTYIGCTIILQFIQSRAICTLLGQQLPHYPWLSTLSRAAILFLFSCVDLTYTPCFYLYKIMIKVAFETLYIVGRHAEIYKSCVTRVARLGFYGDFKQLRYILKINKWSY